MISEAKLKALAELHKAHPARCPCCSASFVSYSTNTKTKCPNCRKRRQPLPENAANTRCMDCRTEIRVRAVRTCGNLCAACREARKRDRANAWYSRRKNESARVCPGHETMITLVSTPSEMMHQPGDRISISDVMTQCAQGLHAAGTCFRRFERRWIVEVDDEYGKCHLAEILS